MTSVETHDILQAILFLGLLMAFIAVTWRTAQ
jgi:hypothetical protein